MDESIKESMKQIKDDLNHEAEVKRGPGRPPKGEHEGLTMEATLKLFAELQAGQDERLAKIVAEAVKAAREPNAYEQRKIDREMDWETKRLESKKQASIQEVQIRAARMKSCNHTTYHPLTKNSSHTWRAQWHTPPQEKPYFVPTCTQCWTQLPKIYSTDGNITNGVNLHEYMNVDMERLLSDAKKSGNQNVEQFKQEHNLVGA